MKEINWNIFELIFNGKQQDAFERMAYGLFCSKFNIRDGLFAHKNQIGIETEPIEIDGKLIGFQAKYLEPSISFSSCKTRIIESLEKAKKKNPNLDVTYLYINKTYGESNSENEKSPKYIREIHSKAKELNIKVEWQVPSQIEKQLSLSINSDITKEFFPDFHDFQRQQYIPKNSNDLLSLTKTAIIQLEIEKIKERYYNGDWHVKEDELAKLYRFTDHTNETIASSIFDFIQNASHQTRSNMPSMIAGSVHSIILTFFPSSYETEEKERFNNGILCIYIGFNLTYDALIHINNFRIAEYGLNIWKYIYREGKRQKMPELVNKVLSQYQELESTLNRPERSDLENAKQVVKFFKNDLDEPGLTFPVLPDDLYKLVEQSR